MLQDLLVLKLIELVLQESRVGHLGLKEFFRLSVHPRSRTVHGATPSLDLLPCPVPYTGVGQGLPIFRPPDVTGDALVQSIIAILNREALGHVTGLPFRLVQVTPLVMLSGT